MSGKDSRTPAQWRAAKLAQIHVAKKQLSMDDDSYRAMLQRVVGVDSAAKANPLGICNILDEMKRLGFKPSHKRAKPRTTPALTREAKISKIRAQLAEAKRDDAYADGIALIMCKTERYEWLTSTQLTGVISALAKDAGRHGRTV